VVIGDEVARGAIERGAAQKHSELAPFCDLLAGRKLRTVLEIGTLRGGTLWAWCQLADADAVIVSVDLPGGEWGGGYTDADVARLESYARPGQQLHLIRGDSHSIETFEKVNEIVGARWIDLAFIDGDHSYEGVKADFADYGPLGGDGGLVAFHDILPHPDVPDCDVDRFWTEIRDRFERRWEFASPSERHHAYGQWGGIGAVEL
jgi:predicted O-methyltransferase YrrM